MAPRLLTCIGPPPQPCFGARVTLLSEAVNGMQVNVAPSPELWRPWRKQSHTASTIRQAHADTQLAAPV